MRSPADSERYILMLRVWHPDLTDVEREALQFTFDALDVPGLLSEDPGEVFMAEKQVEIMRAVPIDPEKELARKGRKKMKKERRRGGGGFGG